MPRSGEGLRAWSVVVEKRARVWRGGRSHVLIAPLLFLVACSLCGALV